MGGCEESSDPRTRALTHSLHSLEAGRQAGRMTVMRQFQVVGRKAPTEHEPNPTVYRMKVGGVEREGNGERGTGTGRGWIGQGGSEAALSQERI
jgi:hypothetical protein